MSPAHIAKTLVARLVLGVLVVGLAGCGRTVTAPEPPPAREGCTYVVRFYFDGYELVVTARYPADHPYCISQRDSL